MTEAPAPLSRRVLLVEACARLLCGAVPLVYFFPRAWVAFEASRSPMIALLMISEALGLVFVLLARFTADADRSLPSSFATVFAALFFLVVEPGGGVPLVPAAVATSVQAAGLVFQLFAKASLGRSFGLVPANRGVVVHGAYRLVRHPVYLGFLVGHLGFLLSAFSARNALALAILWSAQLYRIAREERLLAKDPRYQTYRASVRWRLVPGVF